jgi:hypothetical protein
MNWGMLSIRRGNEYMVLVGEAYCEETAWLTYVRMLR